MDPELAYQLTKLLFDRKDALGEVHPAAKRLELETAPEVAPLGAPPGGQALLRRAGQDVRPGPGPARSPCGCGLVVGRRRRRPWPAAGPAGDGAGGGGGRRARPRGGQRAACPSAGRFALQYRHRLYRAEVTETFAATDGGFRLVAVASPSEAVLDYYELEGRRVADHGWRLEPAATPGWRRSPWWPPRSAAAPWSSATAACRCSSRARPGPPGPQRPP